jgi:hypothetical protein
MTREPHPGKWATLKEAIARLKAARHCGDAAAARELREHLRTPNRLPSLLWRKAANGSDILEPLEASHWGTAAKDTAAKPVVNPDVRRLAGKVPTRPGRSALATLIVSAVPLVAIFGLASDRHQPAFPESKPAIHPERISAMTSEPRAGVLSQADLIGILKEQAEAGNALVVAR